MTAARSRARFRLFTRIGTLLVCLSVFTLVIVQYAHVIGRNIVMDRSLHDLRSDIKTLRERRRQQQREISRLSDPAGSIPEIHERLHLVGPREKLIYLRGTSRTSP